MEGEVRLIENFVSWQGEGPDSGKTMIILRFKTCNLKCPWCDTSVKMRISAEAPHKLKDIQNTIFERNAGILVTGGEPTVERHFNETVSLLNELEYPIANVESNGYHLKELLSEVDYSKKIKFMFSPKIFCSEDIDKSLKTLEEIKAYNTVYVKVVYDGSDLIYKFLEILSKEEQLIWDQKIWLMPEGTNRVDLIKNSEKTFDLCEKFKFSFSSRSHIIFGFV